MASGNIGVATTLQLWKYQTDDACPRCGQTETTQHVYQCTGYDASTVWNQSMQKVKHYMTQTNTKTMTQMETQTMQAANKTMTRLETKTTNKTANKTTQTNNKTMTQPETHTNNKTLTQMNNKTMTQTDNKTVALLETQPTN